MSNSKLTNILKKEQIQIKKEVVAKLEQFAQLLHQWNQIHNLSGAKTLEEIYANIADSLYPLGFIKIPKMLLDVGTGAGFPGLILAIALPQTQVVLAEPLKKRASFLKFVAIDLALNNVIVHAKRVEQLENNSFELITSRAVTNTQLLFDLTSHLSNKTTSYLFYKGTRVFDEISGLENQLNYDIVQKNRRNYLYIKNKK